MFSTILEQMMRAIADAARIPVIIALFCFLAFSLFSIGMTAMEAWGERRYLDYHLPGLLEELQDCKPNRIRARIKGSGLLTRHKDILLELASHPSFGQDMLESLADNLMEKEQAHYDRILSMTALTARLAPMAGLLGTLIPLGPGITALGSGDVQTLSRSLLIAFDHGPRPHRLRDLSGHRKYPQTLVCSVYVRSADTGGLRRGQVPEPAGVSKRYRRFRIRCEIRCEGSVEQARGKSNALYDFL